MSPLPSISLTDLNRSVGPLVAALADQPMVVLTRYNRPVYAVLPLALTQQLLRIAEQAARVRHQPDVLHLSDLLHVIGQLPLLVDETGLTDCLAGLPVDLGQIP